MAVETLQRPVDPGIESQKNPETEAVSSVNPVQIRLAYNNVEALNPTRSLAELKPDITEQDFEASDGDPNLLIKRRVIERISEEERKTYWEGKTDVPAEERINEWKKSTAAVLQSEKFKKYIENPDRKAILDELGQTISADLERQNPGGRNVNFTSGKKEDAEYATDVLYERYFYGPNKESDMDTFINDVISGVTNGKEYIKTPDEYKKLEERLGQMKWMLSMFGGKDSPDIIIETVLAGERLSISLPGILKEANDTKDELPTGRSQEILERMWGEVLKIREEDRISQNGSTSANGHHPLQGTVPFKPSTEPATNGNGSIPTQEEIDQITGGVGQLPASQSGIETTSSAVTVDSTPAVKPETETGNVTESLEALQKFAEKDTLKPKVEHQEVYETSLQRAMEALKGTEGIVKLQDGIPTIVVPDLHARRDFLAKVMAKKLDGQTETVYDLLKQGKINVVCVGDGMHSEMLYKWGLQKTVEDEVGNIRQTEYGKAAAEREELLKQLYPGMSIPSSDSGQEDLFLRSTDPRALSFRPRYTQAKVGEYKRFMDEEMMRSLDTMKMVMDLKSMFPQNFHFVRGNHDDMAEAIASYSKGGIEQSDMVKKWVLKNFGEDFLKKWAEFEAALPLMVKGKNLLVSHTAPEKILEPEEVVRRDKEATEQLTWTDNTDTNVTLGVRALLANMSMPPDTNWFIGHRGVSENDGRFRLQNDGHLIQMNNSLKQVIAYVPQDGQFDPNKDVMILDEGTK